ncbi:MAG: hypothetical protein HUU21_27355 [Polyangiaceae bacterium]|nr:hypothetical protein [Polyangiaceae bacterium]
MGAGAGADTDTGAGAPSTQDLEALARKYKILGELRKARARGEGVAPRNVLRDLAGEFPGALNELDTLPLDEIERRAERLAAALAGEPPEPWMAWLATYHALFRAALSIKALSARARPLSPERARDLLEKAQSRAGEAAPLVDEMFVRAIANPPGGRISAVVFARLSAASKTPASEIHRALFPGLRARSDA